MDIYDLILTLIRSGLSKDMKTIEITGLTMARKLKKERPDVAAEITKVLSYSKLSNFVQRSVDMSPLPIDRETRFPLVNSSEPHEIPDPILDDFVRKQLDDFVEERRIIDQLFNEDIVPPNSMLFNGLPGVGKTYIARWISYKLGLPLITIDLATSISSFLGRSGQNLRSIFEYAAQHNSVLFLDELDSIAKRRDDTSDIGELKRLVNILLKELESLPYSCIVIGATNHPELLDRAIWRRFDRVINIPLPDKNKRKQLLDRHLGNISSQLSTRTIDVLINNSELMNAADICKMCEHIKRQMLITKDTKVDRIALMELLRLHDLGDKAAKKDICLALQDCFSQREISSVTGIPSSTVCRYLRKEPSNGKKISNTNRR